MKTRRRHFRHHFEAGSVPGPYACRDKRIHFVPHPERSEEAYQVYCKKLYDIVLGG